MRRWPESDRCRAHSSYTQCDMREAPRWLRRCGWIVAGLLLLGSVGCHSVSLVRWWDDMADPSGIEIDPMGGLLLLYWVDGDGHVCHGEPGVTGQPGPVRIMVASTAAIEAANDEAVVSDAQLTDYQETYYYLNNYLSSGASGLHFVQFDSNVWRVRSGNRAFRDFTSHRYSIPQVISVRDRPATLYPVFASGHPSCGMLDYHLTLPDLGNPLESEPPQHPTHCHTKNMPDADGLSEGVLLSHCVTNLEGGV